MQLRHGPNTQTDAKLGYLMSVPALVGQGAKPRMLPPAAQHFKTDSVRTWYVLGTYRMLFPLLDSIVKTPKPMRIVLIFGIGACVSELSAGRLN
jgi:hypothetical protein